MRIFLLATVLILLSGMSLAQAQPGPPIDDAAAKRRIEEFRKIKLIEALDLEEEQAIRLFVREKDFRAIEEQLTSKRDEQVQNLKQRFANVGNLPKLHFQKGLMRQYSMDHDFGGCLYICKTNISSPLIV